MNRLMIVVPCFNEQEVFPLTAEKLTGVIKSLIEKGKISKDSGIMFVNDGSRDDTWRLIEEEYKRNPYVYGLSLSANSGHQNALIAGIESVKDMCDMTVSIDADLQDDITVIEQMVEKYICGCDVVYGVRSERKKDSAFKRITAQGFYKVMNLLGVKTVYNHADFRLLSRRAMEQLSLYKERNLFLRGVVADMGLKSDMVYYSRSERTAGTSKYPLKKMISFAIDGITSFSIKPITLIAVLGFIIVLCSIAAFIYILASYFFTDVSAGWSSLMVSIWFLGGVQLFSIGVVGQYVGKTYVETKQRPRYSIDKKLDRKNKNPEA